MNPQEQEIKQALSILPKNIQDAVNLLSWETVVPSITSKYGMQIDEAAIFRQETMKIVVGLASSQDYKKNLIKHLKINSELAESLILEANTHIFKELQRIAFRKESVDHSDIQEEMKEEGIHLIDHSEDMTVADPRHDTTPPVVEVEDPEEINYQEQISDDDLRGVYGHRIHTPFTELKKKDQSFEEKNNTTLNISKGNTLTINSVEKQTVLNSLKNTS